MDDVSAGAFRMFVQWLYTQEIRVIKLTGDFTDEKELVGMQSEREDMYLAELWVLAEKLLIAHLQNAAIETIFCSGHSVLHALVGIFNYIYENTNDRLNPLRCLAVHQCMKLVDEETLLGMKDSVPKDLLLELSCAWARDFGVGYAIGSSIPHVDPAKIPAPQAVKFF
jgi:hypothetical protein